MKRSIVLFFASALALSAKAQNTFPSAGNVGIGTSTPTALLDIKASGSTQLFMSTGRTFSSSRNWGIATNLITEGDFRLLESTAYNTLPSIPRLSIDVGGNIGIGTTSPQYPLHVEGNFFLNSGSLLINQTAGSNAKFYFQKLGTYTWDLGTEVTDPAGNFILYNRSNSTYPISISTANMPTFKTDKIRLEGMSTAYGNIWDIRCRDIVDNDFGFYNISQSVYRLYINNLGNIGIGTTTPDSKLTVKGDIHTREVKVDLAGAVGPDYVFEKDYRLTSLEELKSYIDQNKHLPEIPSAKEMEENGINLKEMNLLLLRKIEEMTLHLIQQNEQIAHLKEDSRVSADSSAKKVEELTLFLIEKEQQVKALNERLILVEKELANK